MRKILLLLLLSIHLFGGVLTAPLLSVDKKNASATIKVNGVDIGLSGFIVHHISKEHSTILSNAVVTNYDADKQIATLQLSPFKELINDALPKGKFSVQVGDMALLAFGYSRALLIAPDANIYYKLSKGFKIEWVHPDLFATMLSKEGHPTPLKKDFERFCKFTSVGLVFIYLDKKVYTIDAQSFAILNVNNVPFEQSKIKLPFYSRVDTIDANWFGEGSSRLSAYAPYYYELLVRYNRTNKKLYESIKNGDKKFHYLLKEFKGINK